jgi:hypothetical protein
MVYLRELGWCITFDYHKRLRTTPEYLVLSTRCILLGLEAKQLQYMLIATLLVYSVCCEHTLVAESNRTYAVSQIVFVCLHAINVFPKLRTESVMQVPL